MATTGTDSRELARIFQQPHWNGEAAKGRWVWGRPATRSKPGVIHVEVRPGDAIVNDLVMKAFTPGELKLGTDERWGLYKQRRVAVAAQMNEEAVSANGLVLIFRKNGQSTNRLKRILRTFHPGAKTV